MNRKISQGKNTAPPGCTIGYDMVQAGHPLFLPKGSAMRRLLVLLAFLLPLAPPAMAQQRVLNVFDW